MAVRTTQVAGNPNRGTIFRDHRLAHKLLDHLKGLELGAAAHNPFNLTGSTHVSPGDDLEHFRAHEVEMCGAYAEIDIIAEADELPVDNDSQDYVISSHVLEHIPNPIRALSEWVRVLKDRGIIFMIVPQRDALESDRARPLSTFSEWLESYENQWTVDTWNGRNSETVIRRGHYYVYTHQALHRMICDYSRKFGVDLTLVARENRDTKVGNGFTLVYRVNKSRDPRTKGWLSHLFERSSERD